MRWPVLHSYPSSQMGMPGGRHVAGGEDARDAGLELLVHRYAVVQVEPRLRRQLSARFHADADHHHVGRQCLPAGGPHPLDVAMAHQGVDRGVEMEVGAVRACRSRWTALTSRPRTRSSGVAIGSMRTTSKLSWRAEAATAEPIQPAPTTANRTGRCQRGTEPIAVLHGSQVVDALEAGSRYVHVAGAGAGGEQQPVVVDHPAVVGLDPSVAEVAGQSPGSKTTARCRDGRSSRGGGRRSKRCRPWLRRWPLDNGGRS